MLTIISCLSGYAHYWMLLPGLFFTAFTLHLCNFPFHSKTVQLQDASNLFLGNVILNVKVLLTVQAVKMIRLETSSQSVQPFKIMTYFQPFSRFWSGCSPESNTINDKNINNNQKATDFIG